MKKHKFSKEVTENSTINWLSVDEVDWNKVFDDGTIILLQGKKHIFFSTPHEGYACGALHTLHRDGFTIESLQGELAFLFKDVERVTLVEPY